MKTIIILLALLISYNANSQSLSLFDIDASQFPKMKAKFLAVDENGKQIRPNVNDLKLTEDGVEQEITLIDCPEREQEIVSVSIIIDTYRYLELAQEISRLIISSLEFPKAEVSISVAQNGLQIHQDFTRDKDLLIEKCNTIPYAPGTDVNAMFYAPYAGAIPMLQPRKSPKKIIIILTDLHCPVVNINENQLYKDCKDNNISIYSFLLCTSDYRDLFQRMATNTNGMSLLNVRDRNLPINFSNYYFHSTNNVCEIQWDNSISCIVGLTIVELFIFKNGSRAKSSYQSPKPQIAKLEFVPNTLRFDNPPLGIPVNQKVTVTARNATFNVNNIIRSNPAFSVNPSNFTLRENESREVTVTYTAVDSGYTYSIFTVGNKLCEQSFIAIAGYKKIRPKTSTLKLTHPNGGETFVVGRDTLITWEGISPSDTVSLEYSIDNGQNWKTISRKASGLKYVWRNIPLPKSSVCLIKINQFDRFDEELPSNYLTTKIEWLKSFGGSQVDNAVAVIETSDSCYVFAAYTESKDEDVSENKGSADVWIVKINPKDQKIIWQKTYGGSDYDYVNSIIETNDGSYVFAGFTTPNVQDMTTKLDAWVVKVSAIDGSIIWENTFGGTGADEAKSIIETDDGHFLFVGDTKSNDGDLINLNKGRRDAWAVKLNSNNGNIIWQRTYGGWEDDWANSVIKTSDGYCLAICYTNSNNGELSNKNNGGTDIWIIKFSQDDGQIIWDKTYGGKRNELYGSLIETSNGDYLFNCYTNSKDGDVFGGSTKTDNLWVVKITPNDGRIIWQNLFEFSTTIRDFPMIETHDLNYIILIPDGNGIKLLKIDYIFGSILGEYNHGTMMYYPKSILETNDMSILVVGGNRRIIKDSLGREDFFTVYPNDAFILKLKEIFVEPLQQDVSDSVFAIIQPELQVNHRMIDMGRVLVNTSKDSLVSEVFCNYSGYTFQASGIDVTSGDVDNFIISRGGADFRLEQGECQDMIFSFTPDKEGPFQGKITVFAPSGDLVDVIEIIGVGIINDLSIIAEFIDFGRVKIGDNKDTTSFVLKNTGSTSINFSGGFLSGTNPDVFEILSGGYEFTLAPNEEHQVEIRFSPAERRRTSSILELYYDGVGSPAEVNLFGEGVIEQAELLISNLDTFYLYCSTQETNNLYLFNTGDIDLVISDIKIIGTDATDFEIIESLPFTIEPDDYKLIEIKFEPLANGFKTAQIEIVSNAFNNQNLLIDLTGSSTNAQVNLDLKDINFISTLGIEQKQNLIINNPYNYDIEISQINGLEAPFYVNNTLPINISANGTATIEISYIPTSKSHYNIQLELIVNPCNNSNYVNISGNAYDYLLAGQLPNYEAAVGDEITISPKILEIINTGVGEVLTFSADFYFNPTLLYPIDYQAVGISEHLAKIRLENVELKNQVGESLADIKFKVALGNRENCELVIDNFEFINPLIEASVSPSSFSLLGVCYEGGVRLVEPNSSPVLLNIHPNPSNGNVNIEFTLIEKGETELFIMDNQGKVVYTTKINSEPGTVSLELTTDKFSNGLYSVILQTPTIKSTQQLLIVK